MGRLAARTALAQLHGLVSRLRRVLGPGGAAVLTRPPGYLIEVDPDELDLLVFDAQVRPGAGSSPPGP